MAPGLLRDLAGDVRYAEGRERASMKDEVASVDVQEAETWVGWCCSYCAAPLEVHAHGLFCRAEGRFFATLEGVHRLLPEERRREVQPLLELEQRGRRDAGWRAEPGLPEVEPAILTPRSGAAARRRSARAWHSPPTGWDGAPGTCSRWAAGVPGLRPAFSPADTGWPRWT